MFNSFNADNVIVIFEGQQTQIMPKRLKKIERQCDRSSFHLLFCRSSSSLWTRMALCL